MLLVDKLIQKDNFSKSEMIIADYIINLGFFATNLRRAGELIPVPDARLLEIYNALRPYRSTKAELYAIGDELINEYGATVSGNFVKEAADIYEKRNRLKK